MMMPDPRRRFRNPIIPGFNPDPSICRVGADYYLVTSSFEWFPGLPIYHSRDLVNWRPLGHVLDRSSQLDLDGVRSSGGIFAATIRHHDGVFYVITTLHADGGGHFVVTSTDPAGPWSEPHWIDGDGIDPSLFFDNGRVWVTAQREKAGKAYDGDTEIWLRELDLATLKPIGEEYVVWDGALKSAVWTEGPHLYRVGEYYYLLTSEGGTEENHAVVVARSRTITGPYEPNPRNPIVTQRQLSYSYPITCTGHADLVQTPIGEWWMVLLAVRTGSMLGRETFLTRVTWEDSWPVVDPVTDTAVAPDLPARPWPALPARDQFSSDRLAPCWHHLRTPREIYWTRKGTDAGGLRLRARPEALGEQANPSFVARRITDLDFTADTALDFTPPGEAGIALLLKDNAHFRLAINDRGVQLVRRTRNGEEVIAQVSGIMPRYLGVEVHGTCLQFRYAVEPGVWYLLPEIDGSILCPRISGGFTGSCLGLYATAADAQNTTYADFSWFEYLPLPVAKAASG